MTNLFHIAFSVPSTSTGYRSIDPLYLHVPSQISIPSPYRSGTVKSLYHRKYWPSMSDPAIDFFGVLSESRRILTAHSRHFLALSVLFLLPLSFFLIAAPTFLASLRSDTNHAETLLRYSPPSKTPTLSKTLSLSLAYDAATLFLSLSAIASVTSSVRHGFFGRPVKLFSALRSLSSSLWRLLLTSTTALAALASISLLSAIVVFIAVRSLSILDLWSAYAIALVLIAFGAIYLQANWALAPVVVVVELSWGVEPLRRSAFLIKGFRRVAVALGLFFALGVGLMLRLSFFGGEGPGFGWRRELPIAQTALASAVMMLLLLYALAANAVLYMYCKAVKGELAGEIAAEFDREYVSLPFDEQKMPLIVSVTEQAQI